MKPDGFPGQVAIGAFVYTVDCGAKATLELAREGDYGDCDQDHLTIRVRGDVAHEVMWETLAHETIHAAWAQTPLPAMLSQEQEEQVVRALTPLLFAVWGCRPGQVG